MSLITRCSQRCHSPWHASKKRWEQTVLPILPFSDKLTHRWCWDTTLSLPTLWCVSTSPPPTILKLLGLITEPSILIASYQTKRLQLQLPFLSQLSDWASDSVQLDNLRHGNYVLCWRCWWWIIPGGWKSLLSTRIISKVLLLSGQIWTYQRTWISSFKSCKLLGKEEFLMYCEIHLFIPCNILYWR